MATNHYTDLQFEEKAKNDFEKPKRTIPAAGEYRLADIGDRFAALIIDTIIVSAIGGIGAIGGRESGFLLGMLIGVAYQWFFLTQNKGQTIGKAIMHLRVVKLNGEPISAADAILRYLGYHLNSFVMGLGWIWAAFDSKSQGWHDKLAGTVVIKDEDAGDD